VHGWGLDFSFRKCVEVSLLSDYFTLYKTDMNGKLIVPML